MIQKLSGPRFQCCKGQGLHATSHLGDYTPIAKYRQKWGGSRYVCTSKESEPRKLCKRTL